MLADIVTELADMVRINEPQSETTRGSARTAANQAHETGSDQRTNGIGLAVLLVAVCVVSFTAG